MPIAALNRQTLSIFVYTHVEILKHEFTEIVPAFPDEFDTHSLAARICVSTDQCHGFNESRCILKR